MRWDDLELLRAVFPLELTCAINRGGLVYNKALRPVLAYASLRSAYERKAYASSYCQKCTDIPRLVHYLRKRDIVGIVSAYPRNGIGPGVRSSAFPKSVLLQVSDQLHWKTVTSLSPH